MVKLLRQTYVTHKVNADRFNFILEPFPFHQCFLSASPPPSNGPLNFNTFLSSSNFPNLNKSGIFEVHVSLYVARELQTYRLYCIAFVIAFIDPAHL